MVKEARRASRAAIASNTLSREALIADQRPWISLAFNLSTPITWENDSCNFYFEVVIKNVGKTPALNALISYVGYHMAMTDVLDRQFAFSDQVRQHPTNLGTTIFPGDDVRQSWNVSIPVEEARAGWRASEYQNLERVFPCIYGCVQYRSTFHQEPRQTGFIYIVRRPEGVLLPIEPNQGSIPREDLIMQRWLQDGRTD
jgi:hypothetical protein